MLFLFRKWRFCCELLEIKATRIHIYIFKLYGDGNWADAQCILEASRLEAGQKFQDSESVFETILALFYDSGCCKIAKHRVLPSGSGETLTQDMLTSSWCVSKFRFFISTDIIIPIFVYTVTLFFLILCLTSFSFFLPFIFPSVSQVLIFCFYTCSQNHGIAIYVHKHVNICEA